MHKTLGWNNSRLYIHNVIRSQQSNNCRKTWKFFSSGLLWKLVTRITAMGMIPFLKSFLARSVHTRVWSFVLVGISVDATRVSRTLEALPSLVIGWFLCYSSSVPTREKKMLSSDSELLLLLSHFSRVRLCATP